MEKLEYTFEQQNKSFKADHKIYHAIKKLWKKHYKISFINDYKVDLFGR